MKINRDNYESILVDYAEGTLTHAMKQEVEKFLLLNPDINDKFDLFCGNYTETSETIFSDKNSLKKIPFEQTSSSSIYFQQLCVAKIEGLLYNSEQIFFNTLLEQDAEKQKELMLFEKTKLIIDDVCFNEKILVKKPEIVHCVTDDNFEEYCIAAMERWLDHDGLNALNNYIANNPHQKIVFNSYYKTRLHPDLSIVYPDKRKIKRFTILSSNIKKYASFIASVAAIVVLAFMIFYTSTIDDKTQLAGNISKKPFNELIDKPVSEKNISVLKNTVVKKKQEHTILNDPFGFKNISGNNCQTVTNNTIKKRVVVNNIQSISIKKIDCPPCKQVFKERSISKRFYNNPLNNLKGEKNNKKRSNRKINDELLNKKKVWELAQAGISSLNKATNTELKVEKNGEGNKTKIAFNSRFISFSTNVNRNN